MPRKGIQTGWYTTIELSKATKRRLDSYKRATESNDEAVYRLLSEVRKARANPPRIWATTPDKMKGAKP